MQNDTSPTFLFDKSILLFIILGGFFITNALVAEFIGIKIFSLEKHLGFSPVDWSLFGQEGLSFNLTAGVILWPIVFIMTDIINEYYGKRGVQLLSFLTVGLIVYAFLMFLIGIHLVPADFWPMSHIDPSWSDSQKAAALAEVGNYNSAFRLVFGQGLWIIIGSLVAFLVGQVLDVFVFHKIKSLTGEKQVWLRATGSTLVSQFVDSYVVLFIAFYFGASWPLELIFAVGTMNYIYKFGMAVVLTPVIYLVHAGIEKYLGVEVAGALKQKAMHQA